VERKTLKPIEIKRVHREAQRELEALYTRMQTPRSRRAMDRLSRASDDELNSIIVGRGAYETTRSARVRRAGNPNREK